MIKVLVADHGRACLYETAHYGDRLMPLAALINPAAHLPERELGTDAPGRSYNRASGARQAYTQPHRFRSGAMRRFAKDIGRLLEDSLRTGDCDGVVLIAAPRVLSDLRQALPQSVQRKLLGQIPKDLAKQSAVLVARQLRKARDDHRLALEPLPSP